MFSSFDPRAGLNALTIPWRAVATAAAACMRAYAAFSFPVEQQGVCR